jgi:hypothetical protein
MHIGELDRNLDYWLDRHLQTWADWMHSAELPEGLPSDSCSGLVQNYLTLDWDSTEALETLDTGIARAVDAAVNDLSPAHRAAIYRRYGIFSVFRFPRENYAVLLADARERILVGLRRRGIWIGQ